MKNFALLILALSLAAPAWAQRYKFQLDANTPEGQLLQSAGQENDEAKKLALYEEFLGKYASHEGAVYAWLQAQPLFLKAGKLDQVVQAAEAALKADPLLAPAAYNALQASEQKKDIAAIKDWSARTVESARKVLATKEPEDEDEVETWKREVDYAKQVITRCEYSLYATALQSTDPKVIADLSETLLTRHPESQYGPQVAGKYFVALQQLGEKEKAIALAEKSLAVDKSNAEMILAVADYYLQSKKSPEKVREYSQMLIGAVPGQAAPAGADPAAWEKRKNTMLGLGHWMTGRAFTDESNWAEADKSFRASLPFIAGNNDLLGPAYFYLGLANYNMGRRNPKLRAEAKRFNELCAGIKGPFQQQAIKNLNAINAGK